jgi:hypothetical protein
VLTILRPDGMPLVAAKAATLSTILCVIGSRVMFLLMMILLVGRCRSS